MRKFIYTFIVTAILAMPSIVSAGTFTSQQQISDARARFTAVQDLVNNLDTALNYNSANQPISVGTIQTNLLKRLAVVTAEIDIGELEYWLTKPADAANPLNTKALIADSTDKACSLNRTIICTSNANLCGSSGPCVSVAAYTRTTEISSLIANAASSGLITSGAGSQKEAYDTRINNIRIALRAIAISNACPAKITNSDWYTDATSNAYNQYYSGSGTTWSPTYTTVRYTPAPARNAGDTNKCTYDCSANYSYCSNVTKCYLSALTGVACANKPANSTYVNSPATYSQTLDCPNSTSTTAAYAPTPTSASNDASCPWACNTANGFVQSGNSCVCPGGTHEYSGSCISDDCTGDQPTTGIPGTTTANTTMGPATFSTGPSMSWTPDPAATTTTSCKWTCTGAYHPEGNACVSNTRETACGGTLPTFAVSDGPGGKTTYTQTWISSAWSPASKSWTASTSGAECAYRTYIDPLNASGSYYYGDTTTANRFCYDHGWTSAASVNNGGCSSTAPLHCQDAYGRYQYEYVPATCTNWVCVGVTLGLGDCDYDCSYYQWAQYQVTHWGSGQTQYSVAHIHGVSCQ